MSNKPSYEDLEKRVRELERVEWERRKTEEELAQIFSMSLDMICIADIDTATFIKVNPAFTEVLGYAEEELLEKPFFDFIHPDDIDATRSVVEQKLQTGAKVINFENRYRCKDGSFRWLSWVSHPNPKKRITIAIARDITEWKRNEEALKKSKALLDATGRMARVGGWELDAETLEVTWTAETYRIHEVPPDRKPSLQEAIDFFHPEDRERLAQAVQRALDHAEQYDLEVRFITARGKHLWTRTICRPEIVRGKTVRLKGTFQDITDLKQAQEKQKKLEAQLSEAMEIAHLGHWEFDVENDLFTFNDQFYKIFRTTARQVGGYSMSSAEYARRFVHPEDRDMVGKEIRKAIETPDAGFSRQVEHRMLYADGKVGYINVRYFVVKDDTGKTVKTYGVNQDITRQKLLESKLQQAQKMESIGSLAGGIAHDFNNILFPIIGMAEMLLDDLPEGSLERENAEEIFKAGKRGGELVKQILAFSRQSGRQMAPTRVQHILKEVLKLARSIIPSYIEIDREIQPDCGLIMADPTQIHQVAMNIVTNAYHAVEANGGTITVRLKEAELDGSDLPGTHLKPGRYAVLSVSDTGHGMPAELIGKIFDPYFTTKEQGKGTGLGLAVVYGIVQGHKGNIKVYSEIGKGTTFNVYLPMMEKPPDTPTADGAEVLRTGTERILLVDDEPSIAKLEKQSLERLGYQVTMRVNSLEALEAFRTKPDSFDLIMTDMTMPNMTGDQLAGEIKSIRSDIPIIICTGFSERINDENAGNLGISGVLMKPAIKSEMAKMVRKVLDEASGQKKREFD